MSYTIKEISGPLILGEGPHWDHNQQALFFVDIVGKSIHKYSPATNKHTKTNFDDGASFIIPMESEKNQFVVGAGRRFLIIRWDGEDSSEVEVVRELAMVDHLRPNNTLNDGKVDPRGRLFAGTLEKAENFKFSAPGKGSLFRLSPEARGDIAVEAVDNKIILSNGLAWDQPAKAFYFVDSLDYNVRRYDYDVETGKISNQTFIFDFRKNNLEGFPDGMTIDTDGNLWIAVFDGSSVIKVDPRTGNLLETIPIPAKQVTSVTFGGPEYDVLFVTSGSIRTEEEQLPPCGATFAVTGLGARGHPNLSFKLNP